MIANLYGDQLRVCFVCRWLAQMEAIWTGVNWADENEDAIGRSPCHIYWVMSLSKCEGSCLGARHIRPELGWYNTPGLLSKRKCKDKARWVATEEAAIIVTLLTQRAARNALESRFKPAVWSLVVQAVAGATTDGSQKDSLQCKTCSHYMSFFFFFLSFLWIWTSIYNSREKYKSLFSARILWFKSKNP